MQNQQEVFLKYFGPQKPQYQVFSPYRVCPLGAHSDHQHGLVLGLAFDKGIDILASPTEDGQVEMISLSFEGLVTFSTHVPVEQRQGNWGDYLRGAVLSLKRTHQLVKGIKGVIKGSLPVGGLSSSAALLCGFLKVLTRINKIEMSDLDLINYSSYAEREYVGLRNGILDQSCVVLSKANRLLYLDTKTQLFELLQFGKFNDRIQNTSYPSKQTEPLPFQIGIYFSGVTRKLTGTNFNLRVTECKVAAWMLNSYQGKELQQLEESRLREIDQQIFDKHKDQMPDNFRKRATHFYTEFNRVKKGAELWKKGDIESFGRLMFQSCESSINNYECGSPELITIYQIMKQTDGIYGGRFSGAGFKGACISLVDPSKKKEIEEKMTREYLKQFPQYKDSFKVFFCKSQDGLSLVRSEEARR